MRHGTRAPTVMTADQLQSLIEDATADYACGNETRALARLAEAVAAAPESFEAWHALAEVNFSLRQLDAALAAAERAHALRPSDLFINTTLSRIWMERGDKARAEHFGAQARIQGWREQLKSEPKAPGTEPAS
jgi:predicted Zn-dependent protease